MVIVPAGVGHRLLDDYSSDFEMIGCYPKGKNWDMCYGKAAKDGKEHCRSDEELSTSQLAIDVTRIRSEIDYSNHSSYFTEV